MKTLKQIGEEFKNDKVTYHRYDLIYPLFLEEFREKDFKMLEIGLGNGEDGTGRSGSMWKEYFPNVQLFIMDIHHEFQTEDYIVYKGDQSNIDDLESVYNKIGKVDLIIDDGSHHPRHQFISFVFLFENMLKKGGYYIVEDTECNYWNSESKVYGYKIAHENSIDFFKSQIDSINSEFSKKKNKFNISSITFAKNCIIIKKQTEEEIQINNRVYRFENLL
jgi:hypothetical protein